MEHGKRNRFLLHCQVLKYDLRNKSYADDVIFYLICLFNISVILCKHSVTKNPDDCIYLPELPESVVIIGLQKVYAALKSYLVSSIFFWVYWR